MSENATQFEASNDEILDIEEKIIKAKIQQLKIMKQKKMNQLADKKSSEVTGVATS